MNPIYWLEIINPSRAVKHLSNHFILKSKEKFMVFTTKPVDGLTSHLISQQNIVGRNENQYLIEQIHQMQPNYYINLAEKGATFYLMHQDKLQPLLEKLS